MLSRVIPFITSLAIAVLLSADPAYPQPYNQRTYQPTMTWTPGPVTEEKDSSGNIIKSNKPVGFKAYSGQSCGTLALVGETPFGTNTFLHPFITDLEGVKHCFGVSAWNKVTSSPDPAEIGKVQESPLTTAEAVVPVTPVTALPLSLVGAKLPEYGAIEVLATKPVDAISAKLILNIMDMDFNNEGKMYVNEFGPITLFPITTGDNVVLPWQLDIPLDVVLPKNKITFVHEATGGFHVQTAAFQFEVKPPLPVAPIDLTAQAALLLWEYSGEASGNFRIYRKDQLVDWAPVGESDGTQWADMGTVPGTPYCYRITRVNLTGESLPSNESCTTAAGVSMHLPGPYTVSISRRLTSAASIVPILVNNDEAVSHNGYSEESLSIFTKKSLIISRRPPDRVSSIIAILVNGTEIVAVNGDIVNPEEQ